MLHRNFSVGLAKSKFSELYTKLNHLQLFRYQRGMLENVSVGLD